MSNRFGGIGALVLIAVAATAGPALAGRCTTSLISGGLKSQCPSVNDAGLPQCPPGWTKVVYRLDKPFPLDGTLSSAQMASTPASPCGGAGPTVGLTADSYVIGCWSPEDRRGCRKMKVLNNGTMCLHLAAASLGCGGPSCASLSTEQVVISNAGAADHQLCRPIDPTASCRSARPNGVEQFRLWVGGLCSTMDLGSSGDLSNACIAQWPATYLGDGPAKSPGNPPLGDYDWGTGAFKLVEVAGRPQCGDLGTCLGSGKNALWTITLVGVPDDRIPGNTPPCLDDPTGACQAPGCFH